MGKIWKNQNQELNEIKRNKYKWPTNYKYRKHDTAINRFRIGHTTLTHGYLMAIEEPLMCQTCAIRLAIKHIPIECSQYYI